MRAPRVPVEEQYRLIMECRKSGLSDHQWCLNNDINPGTFYNWVKRLRKNGCGDIPEKNQLSTYEHSHQEVVKIEMNSISVPTDMNKNTDTAAMELMIGNMNLRISNVSVHSYLRGRSVFCSYSFPSALVIYDFTSAFKEISSPGKTAQLILSLTGVMTSTELIIFSSMAVR